MQLINKNILFLTHTYMAFEKDQIETLAAYFHHIYVLVRYKPIAEISKFLPLRSLKAHRKEFAIQLQDKPRNVTVIPVPLYYLPTERGYAALGQQHFKKALQLLQKHKLSFDLIHAHFLWSAGFVGSCLKNSYHVPFIATAHGYDIYELPFKNHHWADRIKAILQKADAVLTVSRSNEQYLQKLGLTDYTIIPNGFNTHLFHQEDQGTCRRKLHLPVDRKIILTIGGLDEVKGHRYLIQSIRDIARNVPNVFCIIIGNGEYYQRLYKQIEQLGLQASIKLVGEKLHHEIPDWLNACDLFVLPSLSESFGIVQLEAMACGKPVVATINGGSEYLITSQEVGLLCEKANPQDLAAAILAALEKPWDEHKIREYASKYTLDEVCKNIINVYQAILQHSYHDPL